MPILIPQGISVREAKQIIRDMQVLLSRRRSHLVSRKKFLADYHTLRTELELTPEYAQFHSSVCFRSGGVCERRGKGCEGSASHVHHRVPVSRAPHMALDVNFAEHVCVECHRASDSNHQRWLKDAS